MTTASLTPGTSDAGPAGVPATPARGVDAATFRGRFPVLDRLVHLASCSLGARSTALDAALDEMLAEMTAHGAPWHAFEDRLAETRRRFADLVGASEGEIAVLPNASIGAFQVAAQQDWAERSTVVTSVVEFPSVSHVWLAQRSSGARVVHAGRPDGTVSGEDYLDLIDERTRVVSLPLVTYRDGARLPARRVADAAHAVGATVFVDAYQCAGVEPVDVRELDCDYLVAGTSKYLLGLPGLAFLYVRDGAVTEQRSQLTGWFGRVEPFSFDPHTLDFPREARRFETGTPPVPAVYAADAGLRLLQEADARDIRRHVEGLVRYATDRLGAAGLPLRPPADPADRGAHVAVETADAERIAQWLAERDIVVSPRGDVLRVSFHYYNSVRDVDALCEALAACPPTVTRWPT